MERENFLGAEAEEAQEGSNLLRTMSNSLAAMKEEKKQINEKLDEIQKLIDAKEGELLKVMQSQEINSFKTPRGTFFVTQRERASILDSEIAFEFLREVGAGDIIKETVNSNTLSSTFKQLREDGKIDLLTAESKGIKVFVQESVGQRAPK